AGRFFAITGKPALLAAAFVAAPAIVWGVVSGNPAPTDVQISPADIHTTATATAPPQRPAARAPESGTPPPIPSNISAPQQTSRMTQPAPIATAGLPAADDPPPPTPSAAPEPNDEPRAPAVVPTTHAPTALRPTKPPTAAQPPTTARPQQP